VKPELHRAVPVAEIGPSGLDSMVEASPAECAALARRMGVPAVLSFCCRFHLVRTVGSVVAARGRLLASVARTCVVSLDDFEVAVEEDFQVRFVPAGTETDNPDPEAEDEIPFAGAVIDLGEAAAEQLALALDPYPRKPGAELPESEPSSRIRH
jgi:Large ribosomal RNA subunit accumulation protein YceD